jgi:hypothetical protein
MSQPTIEYPAIYKAASELSAESQKEYLFLLKTEYLLLIFSALLAMNFSNNGMYHAFSAFVIIVAVALLLIRQLKKPDQQWYKCRALAESLKTSTWRYMMRADPFGDVDNITTVRNEICTFFRRILEANKQIGEKITGLNSTFEQITQSMENNRKLSWQDRKQLYLEKRIIEQQEWYRSKANYNKRCHKYWLNSCVVIYILALFSVLTRIVYPQWYYLPTGVLLVVASAIVGWLQIKKFNELSAAYTLTAHEISLIKTSIQSIEDEQSLSDFVNDAEHAFSREHTQWAARQVND